MARLSDLHRELTLMIISHLLPDDLENFTSTCRKIYKLAGEDLERHRALKRKHAVYRFYDPYRSSPRRKISHLLGKILQEPHTAVYVRELSINNWWGTQRFQGAQQGSNGPYDQASVPRLNETVSQLAPQDEVSTWLRYIQTGSEDPIISMFILLLPNLSTLKFEYLSDGQECLYGTLYRITRMKGPEVPLSRLRHVQIPHSWELGGFKLFDLFLSLPSVRVIHDTGMFAPNNDACLDNKLKSRTSNLEDLALTTCWVGPKILFTYLEAFKTLRSFTYDAGAKIPDMIPPPKIDSFWIRSGLYAFRRSTLESLTVLSHDRDRDFMGSIRGFEAVRSLHIETQLLLRESDMFHDETSLARALPSKLETLKFKCSGLGDEPRIAKLISALAKLKAEYVSELREIEVLTRNGVEDFDTETHTYDGVISACKTQNIDLLVKAFDTEAIRVLYGGD